MCDSIIAKVQELKLRSESTFEETATQTPRSALNYVDSTPDSPRSEPKSIEDHQPDEEDEGDEDNEEYHDEYYSFLRDLAGSFEATGEEEDSEDENSGEEDAGGEEEAVNQVAAEPCSRPPGSTETSSSASLNALAPRPQPVGDTAFADSGSEDDNEDVSTSWSSSRRRGCPEQRTQEKSCRSCSPCESRASRDRRGPVQDNYDVSKAVQHYAMANPCNLVRRQRDMMQEAIRMKSAQARHLAGAVNNKITALKVRRHYECVRCELLREVQVIEARLAAFDKACERSREAAAFATCYQEAALCDSDGSRAHDGVEVVAVQ
mmetsp:Transcript_50060/g.140372  ORF Transcript_50060/g.140372 Transcript_50060/m.140372 type:complete len:320 (-) Transcript_50060:155-1114(-)